jgi:AcrR family transcriptional regulator
MLDVAEQLLSTRGVEGVSLREIRLAAGQRNTSALQFHFGDRDGLLRAIIARHRPRQLAILKQLNDQMIADGRQDDGRSLLEVVIRPSTDYVFEGPSARAWVRIVAELVARPELELQDLVDHASSEALEVATALLEKMTQVMPRRIAFERLFMVSRASLHLCADRALAEGADGTVRRYMSPEDFITNTVDMAYAALFAPSSRLAGTGTPTTT